MTGKSGEAKERGNVMISLRLMEDTMEDYTAMQKWFSEPELQEIGRAHV